MNSYVVTLRRINDDRIFVCTVEAQSTAFIGLMFLPNYFRIVSIEEKGTQTYVA